MKTSIRLIAVAVLGFAFTSCQKSADQMAPAPEASKMGISRDNSLPELWSKILGSVVDPRETTLGTPDSYFQVGDSPVFFVQISDQVPTDGFTGTITLKNAETGDVLSTFSLTPYYDPSAGNLRLPNDVSAFNPFMFGQVNLDASYQGLTVDMEASITLITGETNTLTLNKAFIVQ